jgi:uncharacterized repeat protein (TIGR03803 family)
MISTQQFFPLSMKRLLSLLAWFCLLAGTSTVIAGVDTAYEVLARFYRTPTASSASLVLGPDGKYWGTARSGAFGFGAIYKVDDEGVVTSVAEFTGPTGPRRGYQPEATMLLASDRNFYGTTLRGGSHDAGTIYKLTPAGVLTNLVDFTGDTGAFIGYGNTGPLAEGGDGNFYGTCTLKTGDGLGGIFRVTSDGAYTLLATFTGLAGAVPGRIPSNPNPGISGHPSGGLVTGGDGRLYGTTNSGGSYGKGTFFRVTTEGMVTVLYHFSDSTGIYGRSPLLRGGDGNFYGSTAGRVLYQITPAGLFTKLVPSSAYPDGFGDEVPLGPLTSDGQGGFLGVSYTVPKGGHPSRPFITGRIFRYSPMGGVTFLNTYWSDPLPYPHPDLEGEPISGLFRTPAGEFLGAIEYIQGGTHTSLVRFRTSPTVSNSLFTDLSDDVNHYAKVPYFNDASGPVIGMDGNLYGTYESNSIYQVLPDGKIVHHAHLPPLTSFVGLSARLLAAHDGNLYACASASDDYSQSIWRIRPDGTASKLYSFPPRSNESDFTLPYGLGEQLIEDASGNLYGTTGQGGAHDAGTIFRLAPDGTLTVLSEFPGGKAGQSPSSLMLASDGNFYGLAGGGSKGLIVFRVTPSGDLATVCDLPGVISANEAVWIPQRLVEGPDGHFYGITENGGKSGPLYYDGEAERLEPSFA